MLTHKMAVSGVCGLRDGGLECGLFQWCGVCLVCFPDTSFWRHASGLAVFSGLGGTFRLECD